MRVAYRWLGCSIVIGAALVTLEAGGSPQLAQPAPQDLLRQLQRPGRIASQRAPEIIERLYLRLGMVVADIGAGAGLFSEPMARAVGPTGKVYAVEIEPVLVEHIRQLSAEANLPHLIPVLAIADDPRLPAADVDLAFFNDVLHHIEHRAAYLKALAKYIKPTGQIALVEFDRTMPQAEPASLLLDKDEVAGWMRDAGFRPIKEFTDVFRNKWFVVYGRAQ